MNDIAVASKKGRRTLYTYFKSKEDIYMAVVESELEMLSGAMEKVAEQDIAPDTKILRLIETHLDSIKMVVFRNGTLRAGFSVIYGEWRRCGRILTGRKQSCSGRC